MTRRFDLSHWRPREADDTPRRDLGIGLRFSANPAEQARRNQQLLEDMEMEAAEIARHEEEQEENDDWSEDLGDRYDNDNFVYGRSAANGMSKVNERGERCFKNAKPRGKTRRCRTTLPRDIRRNG